MKIESADWNPIDSEHGIRLHQLFMELKDSKEFIQKRMLINK